MAKKTSPKKSTTKKPAASKSVSKKSAARAATKSAGPKTKKAPASTKESKKSAVGAKFTVAGLLKELAALGNAATRAHNTKYGCNEDQFGVKHGDLRIVAKKIKTDHDLALELWATRNADAQLLATLIMKPEKLSADEMEGLVRTANFSHVYDWLHSYVLKQHSDKETLRQKWAKSSEAMPARSYWRLTSGRVANSPDGLDLKALLDRLEKEMATANPIIQWTMNECLATIGIHHESLRARALAIGEKLGIYRDYPVSKGCTSPFAPIWINAMVGRSK